MPLPPLLTAQPPAHHPTRHPEPATDAASGPPPARARSSARGPSASAPSAAPVSAARKPRGTAPGTDAAGSEAAPPAPDFAAAFAQRLQAAAHALPAGHERLSHPPHSAQAPAHPQPGADASAPVDLAALGLPPLPHADAASTGLHGPAPATASAMAAAAPPATTGTSPLDALQALAISGGHGPATRLAGASATERAPPASGLPPTLGRRPALAAGARPDTAATGAERQALSQRLDSPTDAATSAAAEAAALQRSSPEPAGERPVPMGAGVPTGHWPGTSPAGAAAPAALASAAAPGSPAPYSAQLAAPPGTAAWQQALGQQLIFMGQAGLGQAELQLHPLQLGPLRVKLQLVEGGLAAQFSAEQAAVREAVQAALPQLRSALAEQGLSLGQADVGADSRPSADPSMQQSDHQSAHQSAHRSAHQSPPGKAAPAASPALPASVVHTPASLGGLRTWA